MLRKNRRGPQLLRELHYKIIFILNTEEQTQKSTTAQQPLVTHSGGKEISAQCLRVTQGEPNPSPQTAPASKIICLWVWQKCHLMLKGQQKLCLVKPLNSTPNS